ncbi:MAG: GNAT family N-acetyltransferase [Proteobacteria bacterium]|jgi:GNAT superfamily N-acetyltransferase|nr:GNAT family N-acetyltransferase [Pseudomonadota bacterium]
MIDTEQWMANGGDEQKLTLYSKIGRVAPFANADGRCLATIHHDAPEVGAIGDWVGDEATRIAAEKWLKEQGCSVVRGPMEIGNFFGHQVCLGPFNSPPYSLEPTEPADRWLAAGYEPIAHYAATLPDSRRVIDVARDSAARLSVQGLTIEAWPNGERLSNASFHRLMEAFEPVFNLSFASHFAYLPITDQILHAWLSPCAPFVDSRLTMLARTPGGEPVGFVLTLRNQSDPTQFLIHTLAVLPPYQRRGVGTWLVGAAHRAGQRAGYRSGVHCLTPTEGLHQTKEVLRQYALLQKDLE